MSFNQWLTFWLASSCLAQQEVRRHWALGEVNPQLPPLKAICSFYSILIFCCSEVRFLISSAVTITSTAIWIILTKNLLEESDPFFRTKEQVSYYLWIWSYMPSVYRTTFEAYRISACKGLRRPGVNWFWVLNLKNLGSDFSECLEFNGTLYVQSRAPTDVSCSGEHSALLQIR